ncbi:hypothetical protein BH10BAC6_BH10BAC6_15480 [soil metagenome]
MKAIALPLAILCLILFGASCSTTSKPRPTTYAPCVTEQHRELSVRWGTVDDSARTTDAYLLNTKGEVFRLETDTDNQTDTVFLNSVPQTEYCVRADAVKTAYLKTQAMNVRGTRARYVEYVNPKTDVYLRVVWNPDLQTFQSRFFRAEFDSLQRLVTRDR